ncbi:MAG: hypothetical protein KAJ14_00145 [Candidatus Omnitrophica bacterium]|nr:hypothetical protein [Candidatus Omnitrophota bacterium]
MDILILLKNQWINFIISLPESVVSYILRMALLLTLATIILTFSWYAPWRSVFFQLFMLFVVISLSMCIPVQKILELQEWQFVFIITTAFLCMIFIPNFLPFLLTPKVGNQIKIKKILLISVWGLFLAQLILAR